ncbi:MAG: DUF1697 domain-containing protein [Actinomycetota bacterium]|nr:DUF1697 domain-containing protein [Actinomycetota bacterium]
MANRFAAFLRGMNLGGRRITNDDLCAAFAAVGLTDAAAFRASGNVVFTSDDFSSDGNVDLLRRRIEDGLADALGYPVPTFLRTAGEMRAIADHQPFPADVIAASAGKLQVVLLAAAPGAKARREVLALATDDDRLAVDGTELYWLPAGGVSQSELDQKAVDAAVGVGTQRTKGTVDLMAAKYFAAE